MNVFRYYVNNRKVAPFRAGGKFLFIILTLFAFSAKSQEMRGHSIFASVGVSKSYHLLPEFANCGYQEQISPFVSTQFGYLFDKHSNDKMAFRTGVYVNNQRIFMKSYLRKVNSGLTGNYPEIYANEYFSITSLAIPLYILLKHQNFYFTAGVTVNWYIYRLTLGRIHFPGNSYYFDVSSFDEYSLNDPSIYGDDLCIPFDPNGGTGKPYDGTGNPYDGLARHIKKFDFGILEASTSADAGVGYYFNIKSQKLSVFANYQLYFCFIDVLGGQTLIFWQKDLWHEDEKLYLPMNLSLGLAWHFKTNNNNSKK
jgi:hypothetical protein